MTKTNKIKLSIIIPYYNDGDKTKELLDVLVPQLTDQVEVMVIDDGSRIPFETNYSQIEVIHKENGGVSTARNMGIDKARGQYITFMDADDSIPEYYVERLLLKIEESRADVIDYSWRSYNDSGDYHIRLETDDSYLENPAVWCRCFKRSFIGDIRFNELKDSTEDEDFSRKVGYMEPGNYKHAAISEYMYYYRDSLRNSKHKRFRSGVMNTKKIVYYYQQVTKEMSWLLDEIKKEDERNEVFLFTKDCEIPELKRYCRIKKPHRTWAHAVRGEYCDLVTIIRPALKCQVCIYTNTAPLVSGISTFIYNFCKTMNKYYDIIFLYENVDSKRLAIISQVARCIRLSSGIKIACDTLLIQRISDEIPKNIIYKKSVQMVHCLRLPQRSVRDDVDYKVFVSQAAKDSWNADAPNDLVIHNMGESEIKKNLLLVSATRTAAFDKGDNENKMIKLANMLNDKGIPFIWLLFGSKAIKNLPKNMFNMQPITNVGDVIAKADYLVQLSDESFSYTVLEALQRGTAVIVKEFGALKELGYVDGKMGFMLPDDMDFDVTKLLKVPKFSYKYDNDKVISDWRNLIGDLKPTEGFYDGEVKIRIIVPELTDMQLKKQVFMDDEYTVSRARADELVYYYGYAEIVE